MYRELWEELRKYLEAEFRYYSVEADYFEYNNEAVRADKIESILEKMKKLEVGFESDTLRNKDFEEALREMEELSNEASTKVSN